MKEYQTYIFDLDGTLLNTIRDLAASVNYALRSTGMAERTLEEVREFVGNGVKKLMERAVPGGLDNAQFEAAYATFRQHYLHHSLDTTAPYPGIEKLLSELRRRGKRVAIVSNKFYAATQELARHTVLEAMRQLGVEAEGAVYIGDSDVDIETAHNCSIPCISVLWGFRDHDFLLRHGATCLVSRPEEILPEE